MIGYTPAGWVRWPADGGPMTRLSDDSPVYSDQYSDVSADGQLAADFVAEPRQGRNWDRPVLRITDLATGKARRIDMAGSPWTVRLSPDGRYVWSLLSGRETVVWDPRTGEELHRQPQRADRVLFGTSPTSDGKRIGLSVSGERNKDRQAFAPGPDFSAVYVTDHRTGREWKMDPVPWYVESNWARFSADRTKLLLMGNFDDGRSNEYGVTVWDVGTGRRLMHWSGKSVRIERVALSPDSRSVLVGHETGRLSAVEVATGEERVTFRTERWISSAAFHPDGTKAVSSSADGPVFVWDLLGDPGRWNATKADALWTDLVSPDAKIAFAAIRKLRANPTDAIAFLTDRVKLPAPPMEDQIAGLLKRLDGAAFADRERAQKELTTVAELVRPRLEKARKTASEEAGRRLDQVLKATEDLTSERLRHIRACEVMEGIGSPEAVKVLCEWATGPEGARLTLEAKESLVRR